jgi:hypothetical protein
LFQTDGLGAAHIAYRMARDLTCDRPDAVAFYMPPEAATDDIPNILIYSDNIRPMPVESERRIPGAPFGQRRRFPDPPH